MIQAYLDDGGTDDHAKVVVMAGFASSFKRWRKFDREWDKILNPPDIFREEKLVFHATDCMNKNGYRQFAGWPKQRVTTY